MGSAGNVCGVRLRYGPGRGHFLMSEVPLYSVSGSGLGHARLGVLEGLLDLLEVDARLFHGVGFGFGG